MLLFFIQGVLYVFKGFTNLTYSFYPPSVVVVYILSTPYPNNFYFFCNLTKHNKLPPLNNPLFLFVTSPLVMVIMT